MWVIVSNYSFYIETSLFGVCFSFKVYFILGGGYKDRSDIKGCGNEWNQDALMLNPQRINKMF